MVCRTRRKGGAVVSTCARFYELSVSVPTDMQPTCCVRGNTIAENSSPLLLQNYAPLVVYIVFRHLTVNAQHRLTYFNIDRS